MMFQGKGSGNTAIGQSNMAPFLPELTVSGGYRWDQSTRTLPGQCRYTSLADTPPLQSSAAGTVIFLPAATAAPGCALINKMHLQSASCFEDFMYSD